MYKSILECSGFIRIIKITRGYSRDLLLDFGRGKITIIPKDVTDFIQALEAGLVTYSKEQQELIEELLESELIFRLSEDEAVLFPELAPAWEYPATISNAVIEITKENILYMNEVFNELEALNCFYYSIIIKEALSDSEILILQRCLDESSILCFDLAVNYFRSGQLNDFLRSWINTARFRSKIIVFDCDDEDFLEGFRKYVHLKNSPYSKNSCGCIKKENFKCNLNLYAESQSHNTCLNRKVSIDGEGNIKNCVSMNESFGNVRVTKIEDIIHTQNFKRYWQIKKDDIRICRDCEFRHICTDCRAFLEDPVDMYSKPLKCGYDPYTNTWEEWSTNPIKYKAVDFYGLKEKSKRTDV